MKKIIAILLSLLCIVTVFASCGEKAEEGSENDSITVSPESVFPMGDEIFKGTESVDLNGNKIDEDTFKGKKLTMVNIWGTFCHPCVGGMPDFQTLSEEYADKDVQVIGIVCDIIDKGDVEKIQLAKDLCADTGANYVNVIPSDSLNYAILDSIISVPATIFLDEDGKQIGENYVGSRSLESWKGIVDSILADME